MDARLSEADGKVVQRLTGAADRDDRQARVTAIRGVHASLRESEGGHRIGGPARACHGERCALAGHARHLLRERQGQAARRVDVRLLLRPGVRVELLALVRRPLLGHALRLVVREARILRRRLHGGGTRHGG